MAEVNTSKTFNRRLARQANSAVESTAEEIAGRARTLLAQHRKTGAAGIAVDHSGIDSEVYIDDPAGLSIEFGHGAYVRKSDGAHIGAMEGLHILRRALEASG